jgi:hypothetical protein
MRTYDYTESYDYCRKRAMISASPEELTQLADDDIYDIRSIVAQNDSTYPETLAKLAYDKHWVIRYHVAKNKKTPPDVLTKLANDSIASIRANVWRRRFLCQLKQTVSSPDFL